MEGGIIGYKKLYVYTSGKKLGAQRGVSSILMSYQWLTLYFVHILL